MYIAPTYEETEGITIIEAASCKTNMVVRVYLFLMVGLKMEKMFIWQEMLVSLKIK